MVLYFVAVFEKLNKLGPFNSSCVGYFTSFEEAEYNVIHNVNDLYEKSYNYAVIEDVKPGMWAVADSTPIFYKWNGSGYSKIECPKECEGFCGFTIH